jgi:hypothetical protein
MSEARAFAWPLAFAIGLAIPAGGCGMQSGDTVERFGPNGADVIPKRRGSVVVEGCTLDGYQRDVLAGAAARAVLQEVLLVCPTLDENGAVAPADTASRDALATLVGKLRADGYRVSLAIGAKDADGSTPTAHALANRFADAKFQTQALSSLATIATYADGLELALPPIDGQARTAVTSFVDALATAIRPVKRLGLFAPPSYTSPSDLADADTWDLKAIAHDLDRVRLMTLDYSCCGAPPGPTTDSGWAVQVLRTARAKAPTASYDLALPLYGYDFAGGAATPLGFLDAQATAQVHGATPSRLPIGELSFAYTDADGRAHQVIYEDATSLTRDLMAWDATTVPGDVGITFYGLGTEDPALFPKLAGTAP